MAFDVSFIYRIIDRYSPALRKITTVTGKFRAASGRAFASIDRMGAKLRGLAGISPAVISGMGALAISFPVKKAIAFEDAVGNLDKAFDFKSAAQRQAFIDDLTKMAPSLGLTRSELANVAFEAGKLGIAADDVGGFAKIAAQASVALDDLPIEDAGQIIGELRDRFGLANEGALSLLDSVNFLADKTTRSGGEILNVLGRMSADFASLKFPPELAAGFSTFARQITTTDELASSGLKQFIAKLVEGGLQAKLMADPLGTIEDVLKQINAVPEAQRGQAIIDTFGLEARQFVTGLASNMDGLRKTLGLVADKTKFAGSMQSEFDRKMGLTSGKLSTLNSKFQTMIEKLGEKLLPTFNKLIDAAGPLIDKFTQWIEKNPGLVKFAAIVAAIMALIIPLGVAVGALLFIFNPLGLIIMGIAVAFGAAGAAAWVWWEDIKSAATAIKNFLTPFVGWIVDVFSPVKDAIGWVGNKLGLGGGGEEQTRDLAAGAAAGRQTLDGRIGIAVTGPGRVTEATMSKSAPGDLGMNVAAAGAG